MESRVKSGKGELFAEDSIFFWSLCLCYLCFTCCKKWWNTHLESPYLFIEPGSYSFLFHYSLFILVSLSASTMNIKGCFSA